MHTPAFSGLKQLLSGAGHKHRRCNYTHLLTHNKCLLAWKGNFRKVDTQIFLRKEQLYYMYSFGLYCRTVIERAVSECTISNFTWIGRSLQFVFGR